MNYDSEAAKQCNKRDKRFTSTKNPHNSFHQAAAANMNHLATSQHIISPPSTREARFARIYSCD